MKITKQQFDELKNASDLEQVLKAVGIEVESETFPKNGDTYWFLDSCGVCLTAKWTNHPSDRYRQSLGNVHRTEADAEHYKTTTLRRWQAEIAIRRTPYSTKHTLLAAKLQTRGRWKRCRCGIY